MFAAEEIQTENGFLSVDVEKAPLSEVLQRIADETGMSIVLHGEVGPPVSARFQNQTLEEGLRRLLLDCDFSFHYQKGIDSRYPERIVLTRAVVYTRDPSDSETRFAPSAAVSKSVHTPRPAFEDALPVASRDAVEALTDPLSTPAEIVGEGVFVKTQPDVLSRLASEDSFTGIDARITEIKLRPTGMPRTTAGSEAPMDLTGVQIFSIPDGSVFQHIGLQSGDVVQDINGRRISTPRDMADALAEAVKDTAVPMRIEVERKGIIEPIYVETIQRPEGE